MSMFRLFQKDVELYAPVKGTCVALDQVPDAIFAQKMLGEGVAFCFAQDTVYAPCSGEIVMIAQTLHALGIRTANKAEVMLHIGLDSVNLGGKGFTMLVHAGDKIKRGQPLVRLDRSVLEAAGINLITPMVVTSKETGVEVMTLGEVDEQSAVLRLSQRS